MFGSKPLKIGLIGLGKIAVDQHIPSINANKKLTLVAGCSPSSRPDGVKAYNHRHLHATAGSPRYRPAGDQ